MKISTIDVTAERPYQVVVGTGALDYLPQYLADVKRIAVIHPPVLREAAARIGEGCDAEVLLLEVPTAERAKTGEILQRCWDTLADAGFTLLKGEHPIIRVMLGDAKLAQDFAARALELGVYVIGFSFPVVPRGQARIRTQMSAAHTFEQIDQVVEAFKTAGKELGVI